MTEEKRRVLLVVRWPVGGIRTFLKYVFRLFPGEGFEFTLVTVNSDGARFLKEDIGGLVSDWILVDDDRQQLKSLLKEVLSALKSQRYDLIHAQGFTSAALSFFPSIFFRTPLILTSHDVLNEGQFSGVVGSFKKKLLSLVLRRCRAVHSVSVDAQENLRGNFPGLKLDRSTVILNGVDSEHFHCSKASDLRLEFSLPQDCKIIGFFGRFMSQKGFRYLVDSIDILNSSGGGPNFHVICFGAGAYIREEQALIRRRGLSANFTFAPFVPDVSGAMKGCDLIAMPSLWEACPLQPMEALCCGVPFVGTDCIGLREVIKDTPAVMVTTGNPQALAVGIRECLNLGRQPFKDYVPIALARYEVRDSVDAIHRLYLKVLQ